MQLNYVTLKIAQLLLLLLLLLIILLSKESFFDFKLHKTLTDLYRALVLVHLLRV